MAEMATNYDTFFLGNDAIKEILATVAENALKAEYIDLDTISNLKMVNKDSKNIVLDKLCPEIGNLLKKVIAEVLGSMADAVTDHGILFYDSLFLYSIVKYVIIKYIKKNGFTDKLKEIIISIRITEILKINVEITTYHGPFGIVYIKLSLDGTDFSFNYPISVDNNKIKSYELKFFCSIVLHVIYHKIGHDLTRFGEFINQQNIYDTYSNTIRIKIRKKNQGKVVSYINHILEKLKKDDDYVKFLSKFIDSANKPINIIQSADFINNSTSAAENAPGAAPGAAENAAAAQDDGEGAINDALTDGTLHFTKIDLLHDILIIEKIPRSGAIDRDEIKYPNNDSYKSLLIDIKNELEERIGWDAYRASYNWQYATKIYNEITHFLDKKITIIDDILPFNNMHYIDAHSMTKFVSLEKLLDNECIKHGDGGVVQKGGVDDDALTKYKTDIELKQITLDDDALTKYKTDIELKQITLDDDVLTKYNNALEIYFNSKNLLACKVEDSFSGGGGLGGLGGLGGFTEKNDIIDKTKESHILLSNLITKYETAFEGKQSGGVPSDNNPSQVEYKKIPLISLLTDIELRIIKTKNDILAMKRDIFVNNLVLYLENNEYRLSTMNCKELIGLFATSSLKNGSAQHIWNHILDIARGVPPDSKVVEEMGKNRYRVKALSHDDDDEFCFRYKTMSYRLKLREFYDEIYGNRKNRNKIREIKKEAWPEVNQRGGKKKIKAKLKSKKQKETTKKPVEKLNF